MLGGHHTGQLESVPFPTESPCVSKPSHPVAHTVQIPGDLAAERQRAVRDRPFSPLLPPLPVSLPPLSLHHALLPQYPSQQPRWGTRKGSCSEENYWGIHWGENTESREGWANTTSEATNCISQLHRWQSSNPREDKVAGASFEIRSIYHRHRLQRKTQVLISFLCEQEGDKACMEGDWRWFLSSWHIFLRPSHGVIWFVIHFPLVYNRANI